MNFSFRETAEPPPSLERAESGEQETESAPRAAAVDVARPMVSPAAPVVSPAAPLVLPAPPADDKPHRFPVRKCPRCQSGKVKVTSTRKPLRHHKCDACSATFKSLELQAPATNAGAEP
ncbi:MAG: hypothetical protein M3Q42_11870 [Pseudomonadota bacterium]|nr:hypothetical protein [Pseudomonadota bacterium]